VCAEELVADSPLAHVRRIRINRPGRSNSLTQALCASLEAELLKADADAQVHTVLVGGTGGRSFCGGYDLSSVTTGVRDDGLQSMLATLRDLSVPTVAVVDGHAVGAGFDLACSCDLRVVRRGVKIGLPVVRIGVAYTAAGLHNILAKVPAARMLLLTGQLEPAEDVAGFGDLVVGAGELQDAALGLAGQLAAAAPASLAYMVAMTRPGASGRYEPAAARRWRDEILDGDDPAEAARVRGTTEQPRFAARQVRG
jgi:enoyl-CoA hydratase/carnithine racemase